MIKIEIKSKSKKYSIVIHKDSNILGLRKMKEVPSDILYIDKGIVLYTKSLEELKKYKNEKTWSVVGVDDNEIFTILDTNAEMSIREAITLINNRHMDIKYIKYILVKKEIEC